MIKVTLILCQDPSADSLGDIGKAQHHKPLQSGEQAAGLATLVLPPVTWVYCARGILAISPRRQRACRRILQQPEEHLKPLIRQGAGYDQPHSLSYIASQSQADSFHRPEPVVSGLPEVIYSAPQSTRISRASLLVSFSALGLSFSAPGGKPLGPLRNLSPPQ